MKIEDKNRIPDILKVLEELERFQVEIGIFGEDDSHLLMIARVHEFGCRITVTPKMRAWFAYQGYPLRADTTEIVIPERSYMRSTLDEITGALEKLIETLILQVVALKTTPRQMYEIIGEWVVSRIQEKIVTLRVPALHPMTIERKRSTNPLIDIGRMRQSIIWRVVAR